MFKGKKYVDSAKLIDRSVQYEVADAMDLVVKTAKAKFDETVEIHIKLGVDSRHADQQVRGAIVLPNGTGKTRTRSGVRQGRQGQTRPWQQALTIVGGMELRGKDPEGKLV